MQSVTMPDGTVHEFPDEATPEMIAQALGVSAPEAPSQSFGSRLARGIQDPLDAGAQMLVNALSTPTVVAGVPLEGGVAGLVNKGVSALNEAPVIGPAMKAIGMVPATPQQVTQDIAKREADYQAERKAAGGEGIDWARLGGNVLGTLPIAMATPAAATLGGAAATGAASGAAYGAMQPVTEPTDSFWTDKAKQAALGAATGGVGGAALHGLSRVIQPSVRPEVKALMDRGVTPTPGQIAGGTLQRTEEKLSSVPVLGDAIRGGQRRAMEDLNRAAYNEALAPIGASYKGPAGREGIAYVERELGKAYDDLLPKLRFQIDGQFQAELGNLRSMAADLPEQQAARFETLLRNKLFKRLEPSGTMDGQTLKGVESELSRIAKGLKGDASFDNRQLGDALGEVLTTVRSNLARMNPEHAEQLGNINRGWAMYTRLRDAGSRLGAEEGVFTPAQLQSAVKSGDKSVGKGKFARGDAMMQDLSEAGKSVLGSKYPDSGTAGRLLLGGLGGGYMVDPSIAAGALAMAAPYTSIGQRAMGALMTKRPTAVTAPLSAALRKASPAVQSGLAALALQNRSE